MPLPDFSYLIVSTPPVIWLFLSFFSLAVIIMKDFYIKKKDFVTAVNALLFILACILAGAFAYGLFSPLMVTVTVGGMG